MNDLNTLLDRAAGPAGAPVDTGADLTRGHRALSRTRRRRGAAGLAGVAAVGVLGVALTSGSRDSDGTSRIADQTGPGPTAAPPTTPPPTTPPTEAPTPPPTTAPTSEPAAPVTGSAAPSFFEVPPAPAGFELQGNSPYGVTFARPGSTTVPEDFEGKIVLMFEANSPTGKKQVVAGRSFWVAEETGGGYARVSVRTGPGEPQGVLALQFPSAAWSSAEAVAFLGEVRVRDGAVAVAG